MRKQQRNVVWGGEDIFQPPSTLPQWEELCHSPMEQFMEKDRSKRRTSYPPDTAFNMGSFKRKEKATPFTPGPPAFRNTQ